jgi:serine/threonine-protein kinase PRP4
MQILKRDVGDIQLENRNDQNQPVNLIPEIATNAGKEEELPEDFEFDFEDPESIRRKEEEAALIQAEERRRRLESIKLKYHGTESRTIPSVPAPLTVSTPKKMRLDTAEQPSFVSPLAALPTDADFGDDADTAFLFSENVESGNVLAVDGEGEHLLREKLAVAAAEEEKNVRLVFDIFSASPAQLPTAAPEGRRVLRDALLQDSQQVQIAGNWDDGEGYYRTTIGEVILQRYQVMGVLGKGVFSTVLKCLDISSSPATTVASNNGTGNQIVAIKLIRNNETMRKAAEKEKKILMMLRDNKRFCVRLLDEAFEHRHHVGFVFEYQAMNLRETLKKYGKDVGIAVSAVRIYGRQLLVALYHLASLKIVHADFKLDNILCSEDLKTVKLCDFGSAFFETDTDNDPTPYLVSRFYRAPEIILGLNYDRSIDIWALCVCLYELFTGHVMFPGRSNNEMLRLVMEVKGKIPQKLIRQHLRSYEMLQLEPHFSGDGSCKFRAQETDAVTGKPVLRLVEVANTAARPVQHLLQSSRAGSDEVQLVHWLSDLLELGLQVDPTKRIKVQDALRHPFFSTNTSNSANNNTIHRALSNNSNNNSSNLREKHN